MFVGVRRWCSLVFVGVGARWCSFVGVRWCCSLVFVRWCCKVRCGSLWVAALLVLVLDGAAAATPATAAAAAAPAVVAVHYGNTRRFPFLGLSMVERWLGCLCCVVTWEHYLLFVVALGVPSGFGLSRSWLPPVAADGFSSRHDEGCAAKLQWLRCGHQAATIRCSGSRQFKSCIMGLYSHKHGFDLRSEQ